MIKTKKKSPSFTKISKDISAVQNRKNLNKVQNLLCKFDGPDYKFKKLMDKYNNKNNKIRNIYQNK